MPDMIAVEPVPSPKLVTVAEFHKLMTKEVDSPDNRWFAGNFLGHSPDYEERLIHYIIRGGYRRFRERFKAAHS